MPKPKNLDVRPIERPIASNAAVRDLLSAIRLAATEDKLLLRFLRDLLTYKELTEFSRRWAAAKLLMDDPDRTQADVARELEMSQTTLRIVFRYVYGSDLRGGYWAVHDLLGRNDGKD